MNNVATIADARGTRKSRSLKDIRSEWGLTLTQAASALKISPSTLENWEADPAKWPPSVMTENAFQTYLRQFGTATHRNLLFARYPLSVARELLEMRVDQIAASMGYSADSWRKLEANSRLLPAEKLQILEDRVKEKFSSVCQSSEGG